MSPRDLALAVIATLILGVNFAVVKVAVGYAPPVFVTALRFAFVSLALIWFFPPSKMPPGLWRGVLVFSVFQGLLHHGAMYIGIRGVDAAIGSIIMQLGTPFALLFAWWLLGEKFGWRRSMGLLVAFAGVAILIGEPDVWAANYFVTFLIISALCWGFVNAYVKRLGEVNILQLTAWYAVFAVPQLLIASAVFETGQWDAAMAAPLQFWALIGFMSLGATISLSRHIPKVTCSKTIRNFCGLI